MSDQTSTIKLGVNTIEGLTHLQLLNKEFGTLLGNLKAFETIRGMDGLKAELEKANGAAKTMESELAAVTSKMQGLKAEVDRLSTSQQGLAQSSAKAAETQVKSAESVTRSILDSTTKQKKAIKEVAEEAEESARRITQSQSAKLGMTTFSAKTGATEEEFNAAMLSKMLADQEAYLLKKDVLQKEGDALHRAGIVASAVKDEETLQGMLAAQAELLVKKAALEKESEALHRSNLMASSLQDEATIQKMLAAQAELLGKKAAIERDMDANHRALVFASAMEDIAAAERVAEAERLIREKQLIQNNAYANASPATQLRQTKLAKGLVDAGESDLAASKYGSGAVSSIGNIAAMEDALKKQGKAAREAAAGHMTLNDAMHEGHSLARGLLGPLNAMWLTWGSLLPLLTGAAIAAGIKGVVENGKELEYQLTFVQALTSGAAISTDQFSKAMEGSQRTTKEGAEGLRALAQAGLDAQESLVVLPQVLRLATVGELSVGQAALAVTGVMNAFNLTIYDTSRISDVFAKAAAISNTSVSAMTESMKTASVVADLYHVSVEEAGAALVVLAQRNITGTAAGTALKNMIGEMAAPVGKAADRVKQLGLEFYTSEGKLKSFSDQMAELNAKTVTLNEQSRIEVFKDLFGERGMKAAAALTTSVSTYRTQLEVLQNQSEGFISSAEQMLGGTLAGQWKRTANEMSIAFDRAFEHTGDGWSNLVRQLTVVVSSDGFVSFATAVSGAAVKLINLVGSLISLYTQHSAAVNAAAVGLVALKLALTATAAASEATALSLTALKLGFASIAWPVAIITALAAAYWYLKDGIDAAAEAENRRRGRVEDITKSTMSEVDRINAETEAMRKQVETGRSQNDVEAESAMLRAQKESSLPSLQAARDAIEKEVAEARSKVGKSEGFDAGANLNEKLQAQKDINRLIAEEESRQVDRLASIGEIKRANAKKDLANQLLDMDRGAKSMMERLKAQADAKLTGAGDMLSKVSKFSESLPEKARDGVTLSDVKDLKVQFDALKVQAEKLGVAMPRIDKHAENDAFHAEMTRLDGEIQMSKLRAKAAADDNSSSNRRGELGDLETLRKNLAITNTQRFEELRLLEEKENLASGTPGHKRDEAAIQNRLNAAGFGVADDTRKEKEAEQEIIHRYEQDNLKYQVGMYRDKGQLNKAYLLEFAKQYQDTQAKLQRDIAATEGQPELQGAIQTKLASSTSMFNAGDIKTQFEDTKNAFDAVLAEMQMQIEQVTQKATDSGGLSTALGVARATEDINERFKPALQGLAAQMAELGQKSGNSKLQGEASHASKSINVEADKTATAWKNAGKAIEKSLTDAFGKGGKAIGGMAVALIKYKSEQKELDDQVKKANAENDPEKKQQQLSDLAQKSAEAQIQGIADVAAASKDMFDQKTAAYKILNGIEQGMHVLQLANEMEKLYTSLFVTTTKTTAEVAGNAVVTADTIAAEAVKNTAKVPGVFMSFMSAMGPWGMAAAAVAIAAVLGGAFGGGGGASVDIAKERQKTQGAGTVLGDESAKSESISKSLEFLKANSDIALKYSSGMLAALQSIKDGISSMAAGVSQSGGLRGTAQDMKGGGFGSSKSFLGFNSSSKELVDAGLMVYGDQTVGSVRRGGINAVGYNDIHEESSSWWGLSSDSSDSRQLKAISSSLKKQFTLIIDDMAEGTAKAGEALGLDGEELRRQLESFNIDIGDISFKGLTGADVEKELEAAFSKLGDQMVGAVAPQMADFQKVGEGLFETITRVANGAEVAKYQLEQLGIASVNWADLVNKHGDVAAEMIRQSIVAKETTADQFKATNISLYSIVDWAKSVKVSGIGEIMSEMDGSASELVNTYKSLLEVQRGMNDTGANGAALSRSTVRGAGGLDNLQQGMKDFISGFFTDAEQTGFKAKELERQFNQLGMAMPANKEAFKAMVNGIDQTTEQGQQLYGALIKLSGGLSDIADEAGNLNPALLKQRSLVSDLTESTKKWLDISKTAKSLLSDIDTEINGSKDNAARMTELWSMMGSSIDIEQKLELAGELKDLILEKYQVEKENAQSLIDFGKSLRSYVESLKVGDLAPSTMDEKLAEAQSQYTISLAQASAGDKDAQQALQGKADTLLNLAHEFYASSDSYKALFDSVTNGLDSLGISSGSAGLSQSQIGTSQLSELQQLRSVVQDSATFAQTQYADQLGKLSDALIALDRMYDALNALSTVPEILKGLPAEIAASLSVTVGPELAINGSHAAGLAYVPFDGYVAELHKGERVLTAAETASYGKQDNGEMLAELRALRTEVAAMRQDQNQHTGALIQSQYDSTNRAAEKVVDGQLEAADNAAWQEKSRPTLV